MRITGTRRASALIREVNSVPGIPDNQQVGDDYIEAFLLKMVQPVLRARRARDVAMRKRRANAGGKVSRSSGSSSIKRMRMA